MRDKCNRCSEIYEDPLGCPLCEERLVRRELGDLLMAPSLTKQESDFVCEIHQVFKMRQLVGQRLSREQVAKIHQLWDERCEPKET